MKAKIFAITQRIVIMLLRYEKVYDFSLKGEYNEGYKY